MRYRKFTSGVLYRWSRSSKDCSSPAFTSSISWTSDLAMASTPYTTRDVSKSCEEIAKVARSLLSEVRLLDSTASETESVVEWRSHTVRCITRFKGDMR